jgi:y4mF family transcriptional regulator
MRSKGPNQAVQRLAGALRTRRKALGITQIELARLAGCGPVFIYDLESAKPTLRLDKLLDVLDVLGLELVLREGKSRLRIELGET